MKKPAAPITAAPAQEGAMPTNIFHGDIFTTAYMITRFTTIISSRTSERVMYKGS